MTRAWLGAISMDEIGWAVNGFDSDISGSGYALCYSVSPGRQDLDASGVNVGSRYGIDFTIGSGGTEQRNQTGGFYSRTQDVITLSAIINFHTPTGASGDNADVSGITTSRYGETASPLGAVRILWNIDYNANAVKAHCQVKTSNSGGLGGWTTLGFDTANYTFPTGNHIWALQVDFTPGTPRARILRDGVDVTGWASSASILPAGVTSDWCLGGYPVTSKGGTFTVRQTVSCFMSYDDTAADLGLTTAYNVFADYPTADVSGTWTVAGNAPACSGDKYRALDDPEDNDNQANDYITCPATAGDQDILFEVADQPTSPAAVVEGVSLCFPIELAWTATNYKGLAKLGGTTIEVDLTLGKVGGTGSTWYGFFQSKPGGGPWSLADFNNCQFGIRGKSARSNDRSVYGMVVGVLTSENGARPDPAAACAGVSRRRWAGAVF